MNDETPRAGANPAEDAPNQAQTEVERAVATATAQLDDTLKRASRFLDVCEGLTEGPSTMALPALSAAARILRNQADAAERLARIARGETRHRTIVEVVNRAESELNSKNSSPLAGMSDDEIRDQLRAQLDRLAGWRPEEPGVGT